MAKTTVKAVAIAEVKPEKETSPSPAKDREAVYDVVKNGVMLAHTYKDPKSGKLKNPVKGFPAAPKGWYASEKFDGYRAIWDGKDFRSGTGKIFEAPEWFKQWLPPSWHLTANYSWVVNVLKSVEYSERKWPMIKNVAMLMLPIKSLICQL